MNITYAEGFGVDQGGLMLGGQKETILFDLLKSTCRGGFGRFRAVAPRHRR